MYITKINCNCIYNSLAKCKVFNLIQGRKTDMPLMLSSHLVKCRNPFVRCLCTTNYDRLDTLLFSDEIKDLDADDITKEEKQNRARAIKVIKYFTDTPHLNELKAHIPSEYFSPKRRSTLKHLYLLDKQIAKSVASHMLPCLKKNKRQVVCETNSGLGLITKELLDNEIKPLHLYESCNDFRGVLTDFHDFSSGKVKLFTKDLYSLSFLSYLDKFDNDCRVEQLLKGVRKRKWSDDPVLTVVGPMPNLSFIYYLIKMLALQQEIVTYGRTQIFALMKPKDYIILTATSDMNLHVYQVMSILFQLFFDCELLDKYSRKSFLPWETKAKLGSHTHPHSKIDLDYVYLVKINFKKVLPTATEHLLHLFYFIKQGFLRGKPKIIPTVEKWLPGIGVNLIVPQEEHRSNCFPNMNIYTEFGQLSPTQILQIFLEMIEHPEYQSSPFVAIVESQVVKNETVESDVPDQSTGSTSSNVEKLQVNVS